MTSKRTIALALVLTVASVLTAVAWAGGSSESAAPNGKALFKKNCGSCHTMKNAGTKGSFGPNLDRLRPSRALVARQVTSGGGGMPSFKGKLSKAQINAIATYVAAKT